MVYKFLLRRTLGYLGMLFAFSVLCFVLVSQFPQPYFLQVVDGMLPGDLWPTPWTVWGENSGTIPGEILRFLTYFVHMMRGEWGNMYTWVFCPVMTIIALRGMNTLFLSASICATLGLCLGGWYAIKHGKSRLRRGLRAHTSMVLGAYSLGVVLLIATLLKWIVVDVLFVLRIAPLFYPLRRLNPDQITVTMTWGLYRFCFETGLVAIIVGFGGSLLKRKVHGIMNYPGQMATASKEALMREDIRGVSQRVMLIGSLFMASLMIVEIVMAEYGIGWLWMESIISRDYATLNGLFFGSGILTICLVCYIEVMWGIWKYGLIQGLRLREWMKLALSVPRYSS
jgi:ABC-type dipeptide/oligopeptide/nickel transport system permease component